MFLKAFCVNHCKTQLFYLALLMCLLCKTILLIRLVRELVRELVRDVIGELMKRYQPRELMGELIPDS